MIRLYWNKFKLSKMHPADLADVMENISYKERLELFGRLDPETAADTQMSAFHVKMLS
jgi:Mg/Co/Ni transporter MgtE